MTGSELRKQVIDTITGWMGAARGSAVHKQILAIYNAYKPLARGYAVQVRDAWCATTVSAAWIKCGVAPYLFTECSYAEMIRLAQKAGIWVENDAHVPKIGDAVLYDWDDSGKGDNTGAPEHIGIVTAVNGTVSVTVTEGNMGRESQVGRRTMRINGRYIRGVICPDYDAIARALKQENETEDTDMERYNTMEEIAQGAPWAVETVRKLCGKKVLKGSGAPKDKAGYPTDMDLSRDMLRMLVWNDRAGAYGK